MNGKLIRVRRVLIYEGSEPWIARTKEANWIKAGKPLNMLGPKGGLTITEESWEVVEVEIPEEKKNES